MKDNISLSPEIETLLHNPPRHWQALGQALVDAVKTCVLVVNPQGVIWISNTPASQKFRLSAGVPLKTAISGLAEIVTRALTEVKSQNEIYIEIGTVTYLTHVSLLKIENQLAGAICLLEESTDLESVARRMRFFKNMVRELDAIIDSSSDGLFVCDAQANVIRVNPASERIHKIKEQEVIGKNMVELIKAGFIDRSAALEALQGETTVSLLQNKDNRKLISTGTPVFNEQGELIRVVVSERDITEIDNLQRQLEEQSSLKAQLQHQLQELQQAELKTQQIIARSPAMIKALERALKVSSADSSVLISGESGVGKGLIANLIHNHSNRASKPLIRINCGAIPETLIESELFGYEAGAFTGAQAKGKPGSLELANGGTLFLDEIAELPPAAQVKLLRFLEAGRLTRLGGTQVRTIDARILAATHRNLKERVAEGTFRHDLFYRLNVIPLHLPTLRERPDCIPPLIRYYIDHFAHKTGTSKRLSRSALDALLAYPFPGNVRELMNICERAVVMSETDVVDLQDLPQDVRTSSTKGSGLAVEWPDEMPLKQILENVERDILVRALGKYKNQSKVAAALGVSQPTIARRLKQYGIR